MPAVVVIRRFLAIAALVALVAGCDFGQAASPSPAPSGGTPSALAGTSWIVKSVNDRPPVPGAVPTITFDATNVTGTGGCNHLGGRYHYDAASGTFAVTDVGMTAMGCLTPGVDAYETAFLQTLGGANHAGIGPDAELILDGPAGRVLLVPLEHP